MDLSQLLNKMVNKGISTDTLLKILDLKDELNGHVERYQKSFRETMKVNAVVEVDGVFNWAEHDDVENISKKVTELLNSEAVLGANKIEKADLLKVTENFTVGEISYLSKHIAK